MLKKGKRKISYLLNEQENRANAYSILQETNRRGISVDDLVDHNTMQSSGKIFDFDFVPEPLRVLNYAYTPDIKGFLSVSAPVTMGAKQH